jgi:hypothetical protein
MTLTALPITSAGRFWPLGRWAWSFFYGRNDIDAVDAIGNAEFPQFGNETIYGPDVETSL